MVIVLFFNRLFQRFSIGNIENIAPTPNFIYIVSVVSQKSRKIKRNVPFWSKPLIANTSIIKCSIYNQC